MLISPYTSFDEEGFMQVCMELRRLRLLIEGSANDLNNDSSAADQEATADQTLTADDVQSLIDQSNAFKGFMVANVGPTNAGATGVIAISSYVVSDNGSYIANNRFYIPQNEVWLLGVAGNAGNGSNSLKYSSLTISQDGGFTVYGLPAVSASRIDPAPLNATDYPFSMTAICWTPTAGVPIALTLSTESVNNPYSNLTFWGKRLCSVVS